jgi:cell division protein FtsI/penicillin-binding protein 2
MARRLVAVVVVVAVVGGGYLAAGTLLGASASEAAVERFGDAWERGAYADMWGMLTPGAQSEVEPVDLGRAYGEAARTATVDEVVAGDPVDEDGDVVSLPVTFETQVFGEIRGELAVPVAEERIEWTPALVFPGLSEGAELTRRTEVPTRAAILSRDGEVLVKGEATARESPLLGGEALVGTVGVPDADVQQRLFARGFPPDSPTGLSGLELVFDERVSGTPGGELLAGGREVASAEPRPAEPVRTTIDLALQEAATTALAGRVGGIAVLEPRTGEVLAASGDALTNAQPPGSTFKLVPTTAALEDGLVKPSTEFPVETAAVIDGTELKNAHGDPCGGTFENSFAESCNSVFAPLGVEIGAERLVEMAERFGINRSPRIPGVTPSSMPQPDEITSDLELGATAIGQGRLLVTPLQMASIAQTIAAKGRRSGPTLDAEASRPEPVQVTSKDVAATIGDLMVDVVAYGTGTSAAIPDVEVAGKTGTAEVGLATEGEEDDLKDHAWFAAYAPARRPKVVVAVFLANAGFGGDVAAPAAREVLSAGL